MKNNAPISGLHWIDVAIIVFYLLLLAGIGYHFSRKQSSLKEFIRGGGKIGWLTLGVSLMAALNSGLDYIQAPALVFNVGMVYITAGLSWIILYPWISRVTLPFYQRLDVYSAYEYLENRFSLPVRLVAASIFILWRVGWMGAAIYVPCLAVNAAAGGQMNVPLLVMVLGSVVTIYTMLGGMKAVVWTDVTQFCIMFGGLGATLYFIVDGIPGGMGEVLQLAGESGRFDVIGPGFAGGEGGIGSRFFTFLTTEVTMPGIVLMVLLGKAAAFTADQIAIQRFQSARSLGAARRSYVVNAVTDTVWMVVLGFVGLALYAYYQHYLYPAGMQTDRVLPNFMHEHFPVGVIGLVIAAVFSASLSSVDSALNASSSILVVDFYNRLWLGRKRPLDETTEADERRQVRVSRFATLGLGLAMIGVGTNLESMGELFRIGPRILGAFFGPLFGIFVLGMFSGRAHTAGVLCGAGVGLACSCFVSFFSRLDWLQAACGRLFGAEVVYFFNHLSWQWPSLIGVSVTLIIGYLASRLIPSDHVPATALTFGEVMKRPSLDALARRDGVPSYCPRID